MKKEELTEADFEAARKLIRLCDLHEGDRVLITRDLHVEPLVTEALGRVCREQGAIVLDLLIPNKFLDLKESDIARVWEFFRRGAEGGVDVWITTNAGGTWADMWKAQHDYGTNFVQAQCYTLEHFRSEIWQFPWELQIEIFNRVVKLFQGKRELRITSSSGTDYTAIIPKRITAIGDGGQRTLLRPGNRLDFPGGCFAFFPETQNGIHVVHYIVPFGPGRIRYNPFMDPKNLLVITVENNWVVDVKGDYSEELVKALDTGNKLSRFVSGPMVGIAPKAYPIGWPEAEPVQWYYPFHYSPLVSWLLIGAKEGMSWVREPSAPTMITCYTYKPTWTVDGEVVLQNGRWKFMDDPEMREMAARFGDPDELLKTIPFPPEMFDEGPGGKALLQRMKGKG
jgi:2,5-dihydroxypyridine 5,6-dioxygenase